MPGEGCNRRPGARVMAASPAPLALGPQPFATARPLSESLRLFAFGGLLAFAFVPVPIFINVSQVFLLVLCIVAFGCYLVGFAADIWAALLLIFLIAAAQAIGIAHFAAADKIYLTSFLFITSLLIAPAVRMLARSIPAAVRDRMAPRMVNWILVFLTVECVTRLIFSPHMKVSPEMDTSDAFYRYKQSLFFLDSNFAGIEILCLLAVMFAYRDAIGRKRWMLAYFLLLATMSRASIAAGICQLVIYIFWRWRVWTFFGLMAGQVLIIVKLLHDYVSNGPEAMQAVDGSLASKFLILSMMTRNYQQADVLQKLFGVGADNTVNLMGIFAHNIVATFVLELGIVGTVLLAVYVWIHSRRSPVAIYLLILPMVINGFSLVSTSMPYFFAALGLLGALSGSSRGGGKSPAASAGEPRKGQSWPQSAY